MRKFWAVARAVKFCRLRHTRTIHRRAGPYPFQWVARARAKMLAVRLDSLHPNDPSRDVEWLIQYGISDHPDKP